MGVEEEAAGVGMRRDTLQEGQSVTHAIAGVGGKGGRGEEWVDTDDLLEEGGDCADRMPQDGGEVREGLALFGQLEEDALALVVINELQDHMEMMGKQMELRKKKGQAS